MTSPASHGMNNVLARRNLHSGTTSVPGTLARAKVQLLCAGCVVSRSAYDSMRANDSPAKTEVAGVFAVAGALEAYAQIAALAQQNGAISG